jgi:hypothetical protein
MVGFSLIHGGAGYWTVPLFASLLAINVYVLWAAAVGIRSISPAWRSAAAGRRFIVVGLAAIWLYLYIGDSMQVELPLPLLYVGAAAMSALLLCLLWLCARALLPRASSVA